MSVLFCDLVGFTARSEAQDPEDVQARLARFHGRVRREIGSFGGTVEKFIGDAVMAVFGAPVAHEDDAERAVRAGLRILEAIGELNGETPGLDLHVRVGIETGEALVSLEADSALGTGLVAGDVVNTAARIQGEAPVDSVAVGPGAHRQTDRLFVYAELAPASVKGKARPVALHRVVEPRSRFGTDVALAHDTPFVGRDVEKALLQGLFERAVRDRSLQLVTLVGEPGVGKTRLVGELFRYTDARSDLVAWRQGRCLPYGEGITFWALGEIVKAHAGIYESDGAAEAEAKLDAALPAGEERAWLRARLLPLLGIDSGAAAPREESFTAWRRFVEGVARDGPAVIVIEDLHWGDPAFLDFLIHLGEWAEGVPLLLIATARPELYERGWSSGMRNATTINLGPLSPAETAELVGALRGRARLSAATERAILERAGGNPLYAEEFVRLLGDRDPGGESGDVDPELFPHSVQALIAARLDTVAPERKALLHDAAVVGKVFWAGALADMGGRTPRDVELALHELARKELVRRMRTSSIQGEVEYAFWHGLVRDVAYQQIPRAERARRHRLAGAWIERTAGERVEDLAEVLAHHALAALELVEAAGSGEDRAPLVAAARRFLLLAGERALGLDTARAEARLARALSLAAPGDDARPEILLRFGEAALHAQRMSEAEAALEEALAAFRDRRDVARAGRALILLSEVASTRGEGRYLPLAEEAVSLLEAGGPAPALVDSSSALVRAYFIAGAHADAVDAADRTLAVAARAGLPVPARALAYRAVARLGLGDAAGVADGTRAIELLLERGASPDAAIAMNNVALSRAPLDGAARALEAIEQAIPFCETRGLVEIGAQLRGNIPGLLAELGRPEEALVLADALARDAEAAGLDVVVHEQRSVAARVASALGARERAVPDVQSLIAPARGSDSPEALVLGLAAAAALELLDGRPRHAAELLDEIERTPRTRTMPYYARYLPGMVRDALAAGDPALAERLSGGLEAPFPLHRHAVTSARAASAEATGDPRQAARLYRQAAAGWAAFGHVPEHLYALLGLGRTLHALGDPGARLPLSQAHTGFEALGYQSARAETGALLAVPADPAPRI